MGERHFQQMYEDALAVDCKAWRLLMDMLMPTSRVDITCDIWRKKPFDVALNDARNMAYLADGYFDDMKELLLDGAIEVFVADTAGNKQLIRDPDVLDFDEPAVSVEQFFHNMMVPLPGGHNA